MQEERIIQKSIQDYLEHVKDFTFFVHDSKGAFNATKKIFQKKNKYKKLGVSDLIGWHHATSKVIFAEVKTKKGVLNKNQKEFRAECKLKNAYYCVWRSIDDCQKTLNILREIF